MPMRHALMYHGSFERNFPALAPGAKLFIGSDGAEHSIPGWPDEVDGLRIAYMEKSVKRFAAVRVQDDEDDIVLGHELLLDPARHLGYGKRFSPEPTMIDDEVARVLLDDVVAKNPDQRSRLEAMRARLPGAKRSRG
ncbi:MAG: hypothetical protein M3068_01530 [Gemmatimonadota bacterium]|nr:hypothetical protein [Gemmatimonadota bacterium]